MLYGTNRKKKNTESKCSSFRMLAFDPCKMEWIHKQIALYSLQLSVNVFLSLRLRNEIRCNFEFEERKLSNNKLHKGKFIWHAEKIDLNETSMPWTCLLYKLLNVSICFSTFFVLFCFCAASSFGCLQRIECVYFLF